MAGKGELQRARKMLVVYGLLAMALSFCILYGGYYHCSCIPVPQSDDFGDKLTYYTRCCVFPCAVTLFLAISNVSLKRGNSAALNPLAGKEHIVQFEKNVLTNTVEQIMLFLMATLVLMTYLDRAEMKILPLYSIQWVVGRILFRIGYGIHPKYRSVGMLMNLLSAPSFLCVVGYMMYTRGFMYRISSGMAEAGIGTGIPKAEL
jgi:uncharacterized MAPEG superfamily protein